LSNSLRRRIVQFYERKYGYMVFHEIFVTNRFGANIAQTIKTTDYRQDDEQWWQITKEKGFYISDVEYDESSGVHGIIIGVRIDDEAGNFLGILKAFISIKEVIREAEIHLKRYETTSIMLIAKDGSLLYRTSAFKFMEKLPNENFLKMIQNERGFFTAEDGGIERLFSYVRSKGYREFASLGWILIVGHDVAEVLKPAFVLRNTMMAASLILIIISIIIALLISRSITKPLAKLSKGAEIIGKGDLKHRVELKSKDEIGELAAAFNQMTERRQVAEDALRESQERLYLALEATNDGLWDLNSQTGEVYYSPRWYTMLGYEPGELPSTYITWANLLHPDDRSYAEARVKNFLENDEAVYSAEFRMRAKNGDWHWIHSRGKGFGRDSKGNNARMIGTHIDITERKQAEEKHQTIIKTALDGFCITSLEGRLLEVNESYCNMMGYAREELLKMSILDIEATQSYDEIAQRIKKIVEQGYDRFETRQKRKDGGIIDVEVSVNFFDVDGGQTFVFLRDITERKRADEELKKHREHLEELVEARTTELNERVAEVERLNRAMANLLEDLQAANHRLKDTRDQLQDINEDLESFTRSVSHDLRAPLRAMQSFAQALLEDYADRLDSEGQDYAGRIVSASQRMDTLILDLLAYSRLGRTGIQPKSLSLERVVEEAQAQLDGEIRGKEARITVKKPLPQVMGHHTTLVQVVSNLLSNTLKFVAPHVRPQVHVWAEQQDKRVRLWVEDNGLGIAPEHQEHIFRVFERLHGIETYPGTGIGLAIVKRGIEKLAGKVGVESAPGRGSKFWIELPKMEEQ